ncbi:hypothetical protein JAAARDRAFT_245121 [Jaapia argillacea MUCL 33604]|uniref:AB hydrolase-1 domain-containing protein n=1 Tax=Jaapia argillacea MUCL 33604 TaxID=933084 RepID=A0A067QDI1_9AGAM|nr:hypothetical protein JAAARDRAFT_245121 [Jaapia argillacea MUCL 33604]
MPYVDLLASDDHAAVWYTTNTNFCHVSSFNPERPTIIMLHPPFLDSTWLTNQFADPRIGLHYNVIAFDLRCSGKSWSKPSGYHDCWVEAADIAFAHQMLHLPPAHVFAVGNIAVPIALRFAILFPDLCLSLTLCSVPPQTELKFVFNIFDEMFQSWCYAEDLESFEHAANEAVTFLAGPKCDPDLQDELIAHWESHYPPFRRSRLVELVNLIMNRTSLSSQEYKAIRQPVLIVQGSHSETHPVKHAQLLQSELVNAAGGAHLYIVQGAVGTLSIVPAFASIVNQTFAKFLSRQPLVRSDLSPPSKPIETRMRSALAKLADLAGDPSIASRPARSSASFSRVTSEVARSQLDTIRIYAKDQGRAFSPLGPDGRPIRKFSERIQGHWFHGEHDGLSYAGSMPKSTPGT